MDHTDIITPTDLENYADTQASKAIIPELVCTLVKESAEELTTCRIPYGESVNAPGWDGLVETRGGFRHFVPKGKSYWEIGTGVKPQSKATSDFRKRTDNTNLKERGKGTFVFVTPRTARAGGWDEPAQSKWLSKRKGHGWAEVKILDGLQLCDWLREYPAIGKWLLKKMGLTKSIAGFSTPAEHWDYLQQLAKENNDPPLPSKLFCIGREQACQKLISLFRGEIKQISLWTESENDTEDFITACLADLDVETKKLFGNKCIFVRNHEAWHSMTRLKGTHVLVAHPRIDFEASVEAYTTAKSKGHGIVMSLSGAGAKGNEQSIALRSPSALMIERTLTECGYNFERARALAEAGALNLGALKRHLSGQLTLPPYANWESARLLAQACLIGKWSGEKPADSEAIELLLGTTYGEWIETIRSETLRSDTPIIQQNENWRVICRGEAWVVLGPRISNADLERLKRATCHVLAERDPRFDLPPAEHYSANVHGKVLQHSEFLRAGFAETLALLGSRPKALSSCSHGKAESVASLSVHALLEGADWQRWASLDDHLPLLAEAAPNEFLKAVETGLLGASASPFVKVFAQESPGITGTTYVSGLLWALEILAWHPDHLQRVIIALGELAAIDPGGNWSSRPAKSLTDIFLPWHPQTCGTIMQREAAVKLLLKEQPEVGWKLLLSLLPNENRVATGCRRPTWRQFIPTDWSDTVTNREYWEQGEIYAGLAIEVALHDGTKLPELSKRLSNLPPQAYSRILGHIGSEAFQQLPETLRRTVWEVLVTLIGNHRQFPDAEWAMSREQTATVERVANSIAPTSPASLHRRLFSADAFEFVDEAITLEDQERALSLRRQSAVRDILKVSQVKGLLDFARHVDDPAHVGLALGQINSESIDPTLLPNLLNNGEEALLPFVAKFVWGRFITNGWPWVDHTVSETWKADEIAIFLTYLPFRQETWQRAELLLGLHADIYWKKAIPWLQSPDSDLAFGAEKLLEHERPRTALTCLSRLVHAKFDFPPSLAERALLDGINTTEPLSEFVCRAARSVIAWLQVSPASNPDALLRIEFNYLTILSRNSGTKPKALDIRLGSDPAFFCEVVAMLYRSDQEDRKDREASEAEKAKAQNAHRLLHGWRFVPGNKPNQAFDPSAFGHWLEEVRSRSKQSGHYRPAMSVVGRVLAYSPPDPDGLWISRSIAEALNAKDAVELRSGIVCGLFNMRGLHLFSAGEGELELADRYKKKADALEEQGFHRFAAAIRELAMDYERISERAAERDPNED